MQKTRSELLAALPKPTQDRLAELQQSLERSLGQDLIALIAFGTAVRGSPSDPPGDIELMLVLRDAAPAKLAPLSEALTMARYAIRTEIMILTAAEVPQAADVFPLLYDDIRDCHVLLAGTDPFSSLQVSDRHRRLRIEQELREAQIRLRRLIIDSRGARDPLIAGLLRKVRQIRSPLHALLRLRGVTSDASLTTVLTAAGKLYQVDVAPLLAIYESPDKATTAAVQLLAAAVQDADQLPD